MTRYNDGFASKLDAWIMGDDQIDDAERDTEEEIDEDVDTELDEDPIFSMQDFRGTSW